MEEKSKLSIFVCDAKTETEEAFLSIGVEELLNEKLVGKWYSLHTKDKNSKAGEIFLQLQYTSAEGAKKNISCANKL